MADAKAELSLRLQYEMDQQSLSRETLALRSGVSQKTIKRLIDEEIDAPRPSTIRRLADGLEIPVQRLKFDPGARVDQLERVEEKLDRVLALLAGDAQAEDVTRLADEAKAEAALPARRSPEKPVAASR